MWFVNHPPVSGIGGNNPALLLGKTRRHGGAGRVVERNTDAGSSAAYRAVVDCRLLLSFVAVPAAASPDKGAHFVYPSRVPEHLDRPPDRLLLLPAHAVFPGLRSQQAREGVGLDDAPRTETRRGVLVRLGDRPPAAVAPEALGGGFALVSVAPAVDAVHDPVQADPVGRRDVLVEFLQRLGHHQVVPQARAEAGPGTELVEGAPGAGVATTVVVPRAVRSGVPVAGHGLVPEAGRGVVDEVLGVVGVAPEVQEVVVFQSVDPGGLGRPEADPEGGSQGAPGTPLREGAGVVVVPRSGGGVGSTARAGPIGAGAEFSAECVVVVVVVVVAERAPQSLLSRGGGGAFAGREASEQQARQRIRSHRVVAPLAAAFGGGGVRGAAPIDCEQHLEQQDSCYVFHRSCVICCR
eukprot:CAMPEP_0201170672 /NCGR_PEP_ID=MMETSP0851-20130426/84889_1 /ASSEMBLY_ACC=CAM_ASM_000631 /TAXON_ID=183588 /ORGANISM="Pseudo-nitzschia fraudulenta, Strain WWA7" /LENGTH=407 /DNA_ID=CAMNT_0047452755 /DNA_START=131 /DNA_END=1354 /DNA_ORIENTATION=-